MTQGENGSPGESGVKPRPDLSALKMDRASYEPRPRRRFTWILVLAVLLGGVAAWAYLAPAPFLLPEVETTTVQVVTPTEASTVLTATGYTYARDRAAVGARVIGRIVELKVDEGDRVRAGDVIAVLDSADLRAEIDSRRAQLLETRARLADARREAGRQERLAKSGVVAKAESEAAATALEVAEAQVGTASAQLRAAEAQLAYTVLRSPLTGVVIERSVEVGEMVAPGGFTSQQSTGSIVRIAALDSLEVEADINESYIARLEIGQPAEIGVDAVPDRKYHGKLRQIVPTADRQKAVVGVKVTIDDADERLVPDMSSTVTFLNAQDPARPRSAEAEKPRLYVPRGAVRREAGQAYVFRLSEGRLERVAVEVDEIERAPGEKADAKAGEKDAGQVEVTSGLAAGETIVARDVSRLRDGERVRVAKG